MSDIPPPNVDPELALAAAETVAKAVSNRGLQVFGVMTGLLSRSTRHRHLFLSDIDWLVTPAIATGQFMIAEARAPKAPMAAPIGAITWALVSDDVEARLRSQAGDLLRLKPNEWQSGTNAWLICDVGEPVVVSKLIEQALQGPLATHTLKAVARNADGQLGIRTFKAKSTKPNGSAT